MTDEQRHRRDAGGLWFGALIMILGVTLMLDQFGIIDGLDYATFWPAVLITIGLVKLSHRRPNGRREGGWWVFLGAWMLVGEIGFLRMRESWPLFLVAIGISMIWKEARPRARVE